MSRSASNGSRAGRALLPVAAVLCWLLAATLAVAVSGCGSENAAVQEYLKEANTVIDNLSNATVEINRVWGLPIQEQQAMEEAAKGLRAATAKGQETMERIDAPEPCRSLDSLINVTLSNGREFADMLSPFADYMSDIGPIAVKVNDAITTLKRLDEANDIPSGLTSLAAAVDQADMEFRTVVPPGLFTGMNQEFSKYMQGLVGAFDKAEKALGGRSNETETEERQAEENAEQEEETETGTQPRQETSEDRTAKQYLEDVPDEWERFAKQWVVFTDGARDASKLRYKQTEFENMLTDAKNQAKELEEKYR